MSDADVVGREAELTAVDGFLDSVPTGRVCLVLEGEPGIGKTTLWREAVRRAEERGYLVLASRPAQSEARLAFAGLADLLAALPDDLFADLAAPQRRAVDAVLMRGDPDAGAPDQRAASVATLSVLKNAAARAPVVVGVDDSQWLDRPTAGVLEFALRRIEAEPVGVLSAVRIGAEAAETFDRSVEGRRAVRVGPLRIGSLHALIKRKLGQTFPRPVLVRLEKASSGNPFYALEIARELIRRGRPTAGTSLPVPDDLQELTVARMRRLPNPTREALLAASALAMPTVDLVDEAALAAAEEADIVVVRAGGRIEFTHPLFATAVYAAASPAARRRIHHRLAQRLTDVEERARHLALAADGPDETVAALLDEAARHAVSRGDPGTAAELRAFSARLTPAGEAESVLRRTTELAEALFATGDSGEARSVLERAIAAAPSGPPRAEALLRLGLVDEEDGEMARARQRFEQALSEAEGDDAVLGRVHAELAHTYDYDLARVLSHARIAADLLTRSGSTGTTLATVLFTRANAELLAGNPADDETVERATALVEASETGFGYDSNFMPAFWAEYHDDFDLARNRFRAYIDHAAGFGDDIVCAYLLPHLAELEFLAGCWDEARRHAQEASTLAEQTQTGGQARWALFPGALVDAHRGDVEAAAEALDQLEHTYVADKRPRASCLALRGSIAFSLGELADADRHFGCADELLLEIGMREPVRYRFHADHLEVVATLGDLERAGTMLRRLDERARVFPRPWILAVAARCRGLLLAARGELEEAGTSYEHALVEHERLAMPFELAHTLLCLGRLQRRRKRRKAAREALAPALEIFERLGARLWAEQTRSELDRTHLREAPRELTPTEVRVAELAASGLTNRRIAEQLFLSPKTVEANLARIYRKLGIRSRAELGTKMAQGSTARSS